MAGWGEGFASRTRLKRESKKWRDWRKSLETKEQEKEETDSEKEKIGAKVWI